MAVNKNFVVKNGLEVNTDLLFADSATRSVGVGSTSPNFDLDVRGGIGATDLRVTGFTTLTKDFQVGASGSAFYVSNTNNLVGVGTSVPAFLMDIRSSVSSGQTALYVKGDMRVTGDINLDDLTIDDLTVTGIATYKPDGSGGSPDSWIDIDYTGNTTTGGGTTVGFGSTAYFVDEAKVVFGAGEDLTIGHVGGLNVIGGAVKFNDTTQSSSKDTGSVILEGGAGIEKNLYVGGGAEVTGVATVTGTLDANGALTVAGAADFATDVDIDDATQSSSTATGALKVDGGVGIVKNLFVGGGAQVTGVTTITGTLDANGALDVDGHTELDDVNVAGAATFAGAIDANSTSDFNGVVTVSNTTQSSSKDTGAIIVEGGAGIEKNLFVGGGAEVTGIATFSDNVNLANTKTIKFPGASSDPGATLKHQSGHFEINNDTGSVYFDTAANHFLRTGGSTVALTLDSSQNATFAGSVTVGSGIGVTTILDQDDMAANSATALASQQSIKAYVDTQITAEDLDFSGDSGTGAVDLDSQTLAISGTASEIKTVASGQSLTISLPDDIIVGNGLTVTGIGSFLNDVNFRGKSGLTSAFWDKSESSLKWNDGAKAEFGDSQDLSIYHTGAESHIRETGTGGLILNSSVTTIKNAGDSETIARFTENGGVDLNFDNSTKFATGPAGVIITGVSTADGFSVGDNEYISVGAGGTGDMLIYHNGNDSIIKDIGTGKLVLQGSTAVEIRGTNGNDMGVFNQSGSSNLYYSNSKKFETGPAGTITVGVSTADGFSVGDNEYITAGIGSDLALYHDGDNSYISDQGTGELRILSNVFTVKNAADNETMILGGQNGAVTLYNDNNARVATTADGADISGTGSLKVPVGTTAQRNGSPADGDIRYNSTLNSYEGYGNSAWGGLGGGTEVDNTIATTTATGISTFAKADYRSAYFRLQITQGSAYQVGRYLLIHDGTTATLIEESAIATGSMLGSVTAAVVSSNVIISINMASSSSATITHIIDKITV